MHQVGVVGYGYWGPNIVRNFHGLSQVRVKRICDRDADARRRARARHPDIQVSDNPDAIFEDADIDVVAVVTPVSTHFGLAKLALESGKHVFVEKPLAQTVPEADELIALAAKHHRVGAVDHTFLFTSAVRKIKSIVASGEIGEITYFDSVRVNLGLFQHDVDVIWDLVPHDLSILFYLTRGRPAAVTASGVSHTKARLADVAYVTLHYPDAMIAHFHVNWLSPVKVRKILIGGTKKMIVYDDMESSEKVKVYEKGITLTGPEDIRRLLVQYRSGDMLAPSLSPTEALRLEIQQFMEQVETGSPHSVNGFSQGREVVEILAAASSALGKEERIRL
ncbi:MAG: Gfo/Idh/MocA family protein [Acidobacteriota bacterium]